MALTKLTTDIENISKLSDKPNQNDGLSSAQLKGKFDKSGTDIKSYLNDTLTEEIEDTFATKEEVDLKVDKVSGKALSTNDYDNTEKSNNASNTTARHTHSNKTLLDTYTQTESNLSDAVTKKHSHSNKTLLDTYAQSESDLSDAVSKKHSHSNKTLLDSYTQTESNLSDAVTKKHTHTNKTVLDGITGVTTVLGTSTTKVPTEKAVKDAITQSGGGDMLKEYYDTTGKETDVYAYADDAIALAVADKVDKEDGKGLSTNDFTDALEEKLNGIESGAEVNVNADWDATSGDAQILHKPTIPTALSSLSDDSTHRLVTDTEKSAWSGKQDALGFTAVPTTRTVNSKALSSDISLTASDVGASTVTTYTANITTTWTGSSAPYSQAVSVTGILATDTPIIDVVMSGTYATDTVIKDDWSKIYRGVTGSGTITFYATSATTATVPIQIKVVR